MKRVCKVKLGKAPKQEKRLEQSFESMRYLYNAALQQRIEAYEKQGVTLFFYDQCKSTETLVL